MNNETFTNTVYRNNQRLYLLALSYIHNHHDAEDVIQNCFLKLWKQQTQWKDDEHIDRWLTVVCINECKNMLNSTGRKRWVSMEEAKELYTFDNEHDASIFEAVMSLPEGESVVVQMYYYEGYSVKEISEMLELTESAVKTRLHRGREKLARILENPFETE